MGVIWRQNGKNLKWLQLKMVAAALLDVCELWQFRNYLCTCMAKSSQLLVILLFLVLMPWQQFLFPEERVLHLSPEQEKDKTHFLDQEVCIRGSKTINTCKINPSRTGVTFVTKLLVILYFIETPKYWYGTHLKVPR
jgi:hypothetical protein